MQTYFILGDSRSGTSLVARILHTNGISMGKTFREPTTNNPYGYFEDQDLRHFRSVALSDIAEKEKSLQAQKIVENLKTKKWGMKNPPHLTFHIGYFLPFLDEVRYIVTKREKQSQKKSIRYAINPLTDQELEDRVNRTYTEIDKIVKDKEFIEIQFEDWFNDKSEKQMKKLFNFIEIPYERGMVEKYIDPQLHRFKPNTMANT